MGYGGPLKNGRHQPITPWEGSWAQQQEQKRAERVGYLFENEKRAEPQGRNFNHRNIK